MREGRPWRPYHRGSHQGPPSPLHVVRCQRLSGPIRLPEEDRPSRTSPAVRPRRCPPPAEASVTAPPGSRPSSAAHPFAHSAFGAGGWRTGFECVDFRCHLPLPSFILRKCQQSSGNLHVTLGEFSTKEMGLVLIQLCYSVAT